MINVLYNFLVFFTTFSLVLNANASSSLPIKKTKAEIAALYHKLDNRPIVTMQERIKFISGYFLAKPYILGSLGEGAQGYYDETPLCRTEGFDCETYVTSILAMALASSPDEYLACLKKLRYKNGKVGFLTRNHFTGLDWNKNNQEQGFVKDISKSILNPVQRPVFQLATATVNKPAWYQHFSQKIIRLQQPNSQEELKRLKQLKIEGSHLSVETEIVPYIPLASLFTKDGKANEQLFKQIPEAAIIEIVRPNWDLSEQIGTHLNISHLGFAFWENGNLIFREASSIHGKVVDVPLVDYLREFRNSPTVKGINIQVVLPQKTLGKNCSLIK